MTNLPKKNIIPFIPGWSKHCLPFSRFKWINGQIWAGVTHISYRRSKLPRGEPFASKGADIGKEKGPVHSCHDKWAVGKAFGYEGLIPWIIREGEDQAQSPGVLRIPIHPVHRREGPMAYPVMRAAWESRDHRG